MDCLELHLHVCLFGDQSSKTPTPSWGTLQFPSKSFDFISPWIDHFVATINPSQHKGPDSGSDVLWWVWANAFCIICLKECLLFTFLLGNSSGRVPLKMGSAESALSFPVAGCGASEKGTPPLPLYNTSRVLSNSDSLWLFTLGWKRPWGVPAMSPQSY